MRPDVLVNKCKTKNISNILVIENRICIVFTNILALLRSSNVIGWFFYRLQTIANFIDKIIV